ncbi:NAD-dependent epimerase/dehydratase family protein [Microbacterium luticocti]|uniref:NAD-dependent epimerase/dehydratase family protein n=1 Tax=Microbacterium luticocti TaxID=451764 RepID=UPI0003FFB6EE|nr:NAD-dependent epimerase/dehydratase family protein [Microbacterium luticocti]
MRVFVAGATGVIGRRLVPLLIAAGHEVAGLTRTPAHAEGLRAAGATPVVCDAFDADALTAAVVQLAPDVVVHELTDLPDDPARIDAFRERHARIRVEGTHNLVAAAAEAGATRLLAQSVAWPMAPGAAQDAVDELERAVLAAGGVVLRYGQFYGPGTYHPDAAPDGPAVHIDAAAQATVAALDEASGILEITDDGTRRVDAAGTED